MQEYNPQRQANILSSMRQPGLNSSIPIPNQMNMTGTHLHHSNQINLSGSLNPQNLTQTIQRPKSNFNIQENSIPAIVPFSQPTVEIQQTRNRALQNQFGFQSSYQQFVEDKLWKAIDTAVSKADNEDSTNFKYLHFLTIILYLLCGIIFIYKATIQDEKTCIILRTWGKIFGIYCLIAAIIITASIVGYIYLTKDEESQTMKFWIQVASYIEIGLLFYFTIILTVALGSPFDINCSGLDNTTIVLLIFSWIGLIIFAGLYILYKLKKLSS